MADGKPPQANWTVHAFTYERRPHAASEFEVQARLFLASSKNGQAASVQFYNPASGRGPTEFHDDWCEGWQGVPGTLYFRFNERGLGEEEDFLNPVSSQYLPCVSRCPRTYEGIDPSGGSTLMVHDCTWNKMPDNTFRVVSDSESEFGDPPEDI